MNKDNLTAYEVVKEEDSDRYPLQRMASASQEDRCQSYADRE